MKTVFQQALDFLANLPQKSKAAKAKTSAGRKPRASSRGRRSGAASAPRAPKAIDRHARKCNVCHHSSREAIEQEFLRWRSPDNIALDYGIADHSSIYRHAHAHNLFARRDRHLRAALESIIEQADSVRPSADSVVRAICAFACINDSGQWVDPRQQPPPAQLQSPHKTS